MARKRSPLKGLIDGLVMLAAVALIVFLYRTVDLPDLTEGPVKVVDGDSLRRGDTAIRLHGIDAPEYQQSCRNERGEEYACGKEAAATLRELVGGRDVDCKPVDSDRYGRIVALCAAGETKLNEEMVRLGWAVAYLRHSGRFALIEAEARKAHRGIWQGEFEEPEAYRERHRDPVQGNLGGLDD
jgi:endonuclease YncB( thermonuclease family)